MAHGTKDLLIQIARRDPLEVSNHIRLLKLISRTHNKAVCKIQIVVRQKIRENAACIKIQHAIRRWLALTLLRKTATTQLQLQLQLQHSEDHAAAQTIQYFFRRVALRQRIKFRSFVKKFNNPLFDETNRSASLGSNYDYTFPDDSIEKSVQNAIWKLAGKDFNLFCENEKEARLAEYECNPCIILNPGGFDSILDVIGNPSFDTDTKILGLMICYRSLWNIVECQQPEETFISEHQIKRLHDLCVPNLSSQHFGLFRVSIKVLMETGNLSSSIINIPNDIIKKLQSRLTDICLYPINSSLRKSFSLQFQGKSFVLKMGTHVPFDIVRMLHNSTKGKTSLWIKLLFENGYIDSLVRMVRMAKTRKPWRYLYIFILIHWKLFYNLKGFLGHLP